MEFWFLSSLVTSLEEINYLYKTPYFQKLLQRFDNKNYDKVINSIVEATHKLKKYIPEVIWKGTKHHKRLLNLKINDLVSETTDFLNINLKKIMDKNNDFFHVSLPIEFVWDQNEEENICFFEKNLLISTENAVALISTQDEKKIQKKDPNEFDMSFQILRMIRENDSYDPLCLRKSKRKVKEITCNFYKDETPNIFNY